jgi:hypothetical protein
MSIFAIYAGWLLCLRCHLQSETMFHCTTGRELRLSDRRCVTVLAAAISAAGLPKFTHLRQEQSFSFEARKIA